MKMRPFLRFLLPVLMMSGIATSINTDPDDGKPQKRPLFKVAEATATEAANDIDSLKAIAAANDPTGNRGTGDYAMMHRNWPCATMRKAEEGLYTLRKAVLWNTFGKQTSCLLNYMQDGRLEFLELHLINEVCQRNKNCDKNEFLYGMTVKQYDTKLRQRDPKLIAKLQAYLEEPAALINGNLQPGTACYISPGLESNLSKPAFMVLKEVVEPYFPSCKIVWNPVGNNPAAKPIPGTVFEMHGANPRVVKGPYIVNLDGEDISFPDRRARLRSYVNSSKLPGYAKKHRGAVAYLYWTAESNGIIQETPRVQPLKRKGFPDRKMARRYIRLVQP